MGKEKDISDFDYMCWYEKYNILIKINSLRIKRNEKNTSI